MHPSTVEKIFRSQSIHASRATTQRFRSLTGRRTKGQLMKAWIILAFGLSVLFAALTVGMFWFMFYVLGEYLSFN
jgi:hypothetical protein